MATLIYKHQLLKSVKFGNTKHTEAGYKKILIDNICHRETEFSMTMNIRFPFIVLSFHVVYVFFVVLYIVYTLDKNHPVKWNEYLATRISFNGE